MSSIRNIVCKGIIKCVRKSTVDSFTRTMHFHSHRKRTGARRAHVNAAAACRNCVKDYAVARTLNLFWTRHRICPIIDGCFWTVKTTGARPNLKREINGNTSACRGSIALPLNDWMLRWVLTSTYDKRKNSYIHRSINLLYNLMKWT